MDCVKNVLVLVSRLFRHDACIYMAVVVDQFGLGSDVALIILNDIWWASSGLLSVLSELTVSAWHKDTSPTNGEQSQLELASLPHNAFQDCNTGPSPPLSNGSLVR